MIANQHETNHLGTIFLINLVFGWTVLGWIAALIWAVVEKPKEKKPQGRRWGDPLPGDPDDKGSWSEPFYK